MSTGSVQAIRHDTHANRSDHDAVLCELRITNDDRAVRVNGGTWNMGNGTMDDLALLLEIVGEKGFLCLQEAGGQLDRIMAAASDRRFRLLSRTAAPGAASTIVLVGPALTTRQMVVHPLLEQQFVGRGAGPDHNKPKVANGGRVSCEGVVFGIFSAHQLASLQNTEREKHGRIWAEHLTRVTFAKQVPWIVGADWNTDLRTTRPPLTKMLLDQGWTTNQHQLGMRSTHGRRVIDALAWRASINVAP